MGRKREPMVKQLGKNVNNRCVWATGIWMFNVLFLRLQHFYQFEIISKQNIFEVILFIGIKIQSLFISKYET